jgi:hypothetical protein
MRRRMARPRFAASSIRGAAAAQVLMTIAKFVYVRTHKLVLGSTVFALHRSQDGLHALRRIPKRDNTDVNERSRWLPLTQLVEEFLHAINVPGVLRPPVSFQECRICCSCQYYIDTVGLCADLLHLREQPFGFLQVCPLGVSVNDRIE